MRKLFLILWSVAAWSATTTVTQPIVGPDGQPASGTINIRISAPCASGSDYVGAKTISRAFAGTLTVKLVPNDACTPANTTYTVGWTFSDGRTLNQTWSVPTSASPVTVDSVVVAAPVYTGGSPGTGGAVSSVAGRTGDVVLGQADIAGLVSALAGKESILSFSSPLSRTGNTVSCPTCGTGLVTSVAGRAGDVVLGQSDISGLVSALGGKQPAITTGTTSQYFRGDLSLATFPTTWDWANLTSKPTTFAPPLPGASTLGGVKSGDCTGTDKVSGVDPATGAIKCTADQTGSSAVPVVASFSPPSTCSSSGGTGTNSCTLSSGTTLTVTHNLGTTTPWVAAYDGSGNMLGSTGASTSIVSVVANSANQVTIGFSGVTAGILVVSSGAMGPAGATGATGPAPTVTAESPGANCTNGGVKVVSGGSTVYACNGANGSGSGDVLGPATNTDGKIPQWNGANSKMLKDGLTVVTTLGSPGSDTNIPTEQAVRTALGSVGGGAGVTFTGGASTNISAGATNYLGGINWTAGITTITSSGMFVVPITTNLSKLFIVSSSGAGTSQTITYNVVKCPGAVAGSCSVPAGTLTCTITGNSQITCNDTAHTVSVSAGDGVLLQVVSSASAIAARPTFTIQ